MDMGENSVKNVQPKQRAIVTRMCRVTGKYRVSGRVGPLVVQREHDQIVQGGREVQDEQDIGNNTDQINCAEGNSDQIVQGDRKVQGEWEIGAIVNKLCRENKIRLCRMVESRILGLIVTKL